MKFFNKLKMKISCLIERIKLSEFDYRTMKAQAQMYKAMMSTIRYNTEREYEPVYDTNGVLITNLFKARVSTIHVNITEMLAEGGITFNNNAVKLDVTGI